MKHGVTHEVSVLSAASVAGAQMAMAILAAAPPSSCLMGEVVCDDVLLTVRGSSGNTWHRVCVSVCVTVWGGAFAMWRMDICTVCMKRSGLGAYCGSNIIETPGRQQRWNPGSSTKLCQGCRRKLSVQTPKPLPPFPLPHTHSRLALTHCVSSSNSLHSLLP